MANNPYRQKDRFLALSGVGKIQSAADVGMADGDIDTRHRCEVSMEEVITRREIRDCRNQFLIDEKIRTRALRFTFTYQEVTPQILAMWLAYYLGSVAAPSGTPADEVQTLTRSGTVSGGDFTLSLTLEGRTAVTKPIAFDASTADIAAALTATRMNFIHPGDVSVSGDWTAGMAVTFIGRLAKANLATMVVDNTNITGSGSIAIAATTSGANKFHDLSRATSDDKVRFSICVGWDTVTDRVEKYIGCVCDSFQPTLNRRQAVGLTVSVIAPWEPEILTGFAIPACVNIDALMTDDCKVQINSGWESTDINVESYNLSDNVALDEASAFGFDSVDVQDLERADQPTYEITAGIFASETDPIYVLANNERTQVPVDYRTHFGQPGNRLTLISTKTKIKFQNTRLAYAGTLNKSVVQIQGTPYLDSTEPPISGEAYLSQTAAFLQTSS